MPRRIQVTLAPLLVSLLLVAPAWSWGSAGHHIIAIIAEQRLSPAARDKSRTLLMDGKYQIVDISTCANQLRSASRDGDRPGQAMCQTLAGEVSPTNGTWL